MFVFRTYPCLKRHLSLISDDKDKVIYPINGKIRKGFYDKKTPPKFLLLKIKNI
jgi:hypothetical protein